MLEKFTTTVPLACGFEGLHNVDEHIRWILLDFFKENNISAEFQGDLEVQFIYTPSEEEVKG